MIKKIFMFIIFYFL